MCSLIEALMLANIEKQFFTMKLLFIILSVASAIVVSSPVPDPTPLPDPLPKAVPKAVDRRSAEYGYPSYASFYFQRPYASGYASYIGHPYGRYWGSLYSPHSDFYGHGFGYGSHLYGYENPWYY